MPEVLHETGRCAVSFTVVSVDGHLTDGRYPFWVVTRATEPSSGDVTVVRRGLPWVLGGPPGLVIVLVRLVTVRTWDQCGTKTLWDRCDQWSRAMLESPGGQTIVT